MAPNTRHVSTQTTTPSTPRSQEDFHPPPTKTEDDQEDMPKVKCSGSSLTPLGSHSPRLPPPTPPIAPVPLGDTQPMDPRHEDSLSLSPSQPSKAPDTPTKPSSPPIPRGSARTGQLTLSPTPNNAPEQDSPMGGPTLQPHSEHPCQAEVSPPPEHVHSGKDKVQGKSKDQQMFHPPSSMFRITSTSHTQVIPRRVSRNGS